MGEDTKYCGNCKREVSAKNFTVHSVHCQRNIAVCSMCSEPVPRTAYQTHVTEVHKSVPCPKCGTLVEPFLLFAHEKEECPKRLVACEHCELEVTAGEFEKHKEYCEARTELCKGCMKYVRFKYLQFHYEHDHKYLSPEEREQHENASDDEGSECPICLGPVTLPLALECGHIFCMVCVKGIANTTKNCAICRRDIARDMLMDIRFCREEDIIKNYVNKPREKKTTRSHSVPSRTSTTTSYSSSGRRPGRTTQEYDDMVSALLSTRTSSTAYRYQRPANTHTPPSYTPYSSSTTSSESCKDSCKDEDTKEDDDCCCSSSSAAASSSSSSSTTTTTSTAYTSRSTSTATSTSSSVPKPSSITSTSSSYSSSTESSRSTSVSSTASRTSSLTTRSAITSSTSSAVSSAVSSTTASTTTTTSSSSAYGARPRRPTSLALESVSSTTSSSPRSGEPGETKPPSNATQEQYDRWLAFQLAKTEDDIPASVFNKRHVPTFRRSLSMPERAHTPSSDSSSSSEDDEEDSDSPASPRASRRPPASPRTSSTAASSSTSSSTRGAISKSSSDSNAAGGAGVLSTGARPKNTGLKKRVSFKEDAPPVRREAPVMLPCEFCDEMFAERDLMRHQTSCERNETQLPRESRLALRAAAALAATATSSSTSSITITARSAPTSPRRSPAPTPTRTTPPMATPRRSTTPSKALAPVPPRSQSATSSRRSPTPASPGPSRSSATGRKASSSSPVSGLMSPPPSCPASVSPPPVSPPPTTTITIVDQKPSVVVSPGISSASNRPFSVSPAPSGSTSTSSVNSGSMSSSSVSTTPSNSSSASPVPASTATPELAPPDTPTTDLEYDYEDEETPFAKPRRGRLLSSAIFSWRNISGSKKGYVRSNTAPLEDIGADDEAAPTVPVTTSRSATQLPCNASPDAEPSTPQPSTHAQPSTTTTQPSMAEPEVKQVSPGPSQEHAETVFIKNPNKYRAPPPPMAPPTLPSNAPKVAASPSPSLNGSVSSPTPSSPPPSVNGYVKSPTPTSPPPSVNGYVKSPTPWEKAFSKATSPPPAPAPEKTLANGYVNGVIKFDSKTMMNGHLTKEHEELIPCEFCKQVFSPDKFRLHQTLCEAAHHPPALRPTSPLDQPAAPKGKGTRHKKGPAPPPPPEPTSPDFDADYDDHSIRRMERSQSVKDDRTSYMERSSSRRLERASSIKESSRSSYKESPSISRRWGSRDVLYSNGLDSPSSLASTSGVSGSTSNLFSSYTSGHSWTQHISMVRGDVRSHSAATSSGHYYNNGGDSENGVEGEVESDMCGVDSDKSRYSNSLLMEVRAALNKTSFSHNAADAGPRYRERSCSRPRPASMYTSSSGTGTWGSMMDLSSPTRSFNISDAFSTASLATKRRYIR